MSMLRFALPAIVGRQASQETPSVVKALPGFQLFKRQSDLVYTCEPPAGYTDLCYIHGCGQADHEPEMVNARQVLTAVWMYVAGRTKPTDCGRRLRVGIVGGQKQVMRIAVDPAGVRRRMKRAGLDADAAFCVWLREDWAVLDSETGELLVGWQVGVAAVNHTLDHGTAPDLLR